MTDYKLDGLSPRLFEHIIQELAVGVISSTVTPFGDGADGGREATFEGQTSYGSDDKHWNGYGIIQAKYKLRQQSVAQDGSWAISQLRQELKQFTRTDKPREAPDYYIFATNVVLAPNEGGTKDKLFDVLRKFAEKKKLQGFDVWDYDKLRLLISRDERVKRSYLAWLSPSDVLAELCDFFESQKKDYYKIILRYLQNELLADQYAKLEQAGDTKDEAIPLSQVFIDLPTSDHLVSLEAPESQDATGPRFVEQIVHVAGIELRSEVSVTLPDHVERQSRPRRGRFVLIGGPGQGKTTVSQYICQIFRSQILQTVPQHLLSPEASVALANFLSKCNEDYIPSARRLPFRIVLSEFARSLSEGKVQSLMGYLAMKLCAKADIKLTAVDAEKIIGQYPAVVILDGLDEVPSSTNREEVISAVSSFSIDVSTGGLDVLIVATSRPQGYNEEFSPSQYYHQYLIPLPPADAMAYGSGLAQIRFGSNEDRYQKVVGRIERALNKPATVRLMRTPLQVTILTLLVDRMGDPPDERWSLFKDYYQLIYERETERDIPTVAVLKSNRIEVDVIHRRVGIALQVESERSGGTDARLTVDQFAQLVEDYLKEENHEEPSLSILKRQIIEAAANRLVFLVGVESGQVGFEIRSLQEFMAAEGIMDVEDQYIYDRLRAIAPSSHWRNVYLFAVGKCFAERRYMRPAIEGICNELNDDPDDESLRTLMVGSQLALDLLEDGPARKAPLTRGGMTRLALKLLSNALSGSARLAGVCEEETKYIFLEDLRVRLIGSTGETSLAALECLTYLVERYGGDFENLARELMDQRRLSETEVTEITRAASGLNSWLTTKLTELIRKTPIPIRSIVAGNNKNQQYGPWPVARQPPWLKWYLEFSAGPFHRTGRYQLRLSYDRECVWNFDFRPLAGSDDYGLMPPDDVPREGSWDDFRLLGTFCMNPNKETLAEVLRGVSFTSSFDELFSPGRFALLSKYPWPLTEALEASRYSPDGAVLRAVEAGQYGDTDEWLSDEQKYIEGSDIMDIAAADPIAMTDDGGLYSFPFRSLGGMEFRAKPSATDINGMVRLFQDVDSTLIRGFLSPIILSLGRRMPELLNPTWVGDVVAATISRFAYISPYFYDFIDSIELGDRRWNDVFGALPIEILELQFARHATDVANVRDVQLIRAYEMDRRNTGLLVPIANRLLRRPTVAVPFALGTDITVDADEPAIIKVAAAVCMILAGTSVARLPDDVAAVCISNTEATDIIVSAVSRRGLDYRTERDELMGLWRLSQLPDNVLDYYLRNNLNRRPSGLTSSAEWERLNFPPSLYRLLTAKTL